MTPRLIIHGGAGPWKEDNHDEVLSGMRRAAEIGWDVLKTGGTALQAVEHATVYLEDHPLFDAGYGSFLNEFGEVEMDALLVDGATGKFGAVAGVQRVKNPISLARIVLMETKHHFFLAEGAEYLAIEHGIQLVPNLSFVTEKEFAAFQRRLQRIEPAWPGHGTVGAVALDANANIATATTTGGSPDKKKGRVGDVPVFGSGGYADNRVGGASATGIGEHIMRHLLSKTVIDLIDAGHTALSAAQEGVQRVERNISPSEVGIITIDVQGRLGAAHTTAHMPVSWIDEDGKPQVAMCQPYF